MLAGKYTLMQNYFCRIALILPVRKNPENIFRIFMVRDGHSTPDCMSPFMSLETFLRHVLLPGSAGALCAVRCRSGARVQTAGSACTQGSGAGVQQTAGVQGTIGSGIQGSHTGIQGTTGVQTSGGSGVQSCTAIECAVGIQGTIGSCIQNS